MSTISTAHKPWLPKRSVTVQTLCGGKRHAVTLTPRGKLVLRHHPRYATEQVLIAMGGERPACFELLRIWRIIVRYMNPEDNYDSLSYLATIPQKFHAPLWHIIQGSSMVREQRQPEPYDWKEALLLRIEQAALMILEQCDYPKVTRTNIRVFVQHNKDFQPYALPYVLPYVYFAGGRLGMNIYLRDTWWILHVRHLSMIEGYFTLRCLDPIPRTPVSESRVLMLMPEPIPLGQRPKMRQAIASWSPRQHRYRLTWLPEHEG